MEIFKSKDLGKRYGYVFMLASLLLILAFFPFFNQEPLAQVAFNVIFSLIFLSSLYTISVSKREFYIGLIFCIPALITRWLTYYLTDPFSVILNYVVTFFFFTFMIVAIFYAIFKVKKVSMNMVYGATCVYLLMGIAWAIIFALIDYFVPSAFQGIDNSPFQQGSLDMLTFRFENLLYYSFVTLTTLGYGDIIPLFPGAQFLSIIEAITGQLYIATVIARLLGIYLSYKTRV